jgi:hypothetical protein
MAEQFDPMAWIRKEFKLDELYRAIGHFVFQFSGLEFAIRDALGRSLKLKKVLFHPITASYDFATLCRVTSIALQDQKRDDHELCNYIDKVFRECLALNDQRVRIVHGIWMLGNKAMHVSRGTFKASDYFETSQEVEKEAERAYRLMGLVGQLVHGHRRSGASLRPSALGGETLGPSRRTSAAALRRSWRFISSSVPHGGSHGGDRCGRMGGYRRVGQMGGSQAVAIALTPSGASR